LATVPAGQSPAAGALYISDSSTHRILKFSGGHLTIVGFDPVNELFA
jgi:hypothetical protein